MSDPKKSNELTIWHKRGTKVVRVPLVMVIATFVTIIGLTVMLWSVERGRKTHMRVEQPGEFSVLLPSIVGLTGGNIDSGNKVDLLENGDGYFPRLLEGINGAKLSINLESYIWWNGDICLQIAEALAAKARQGVEVRVLLDASGAHKMDGKLLELMTKAGCQVRKFHPIRFSNLGRLNNRDHRKIAIIDGRIGFIGGHGIAEQWTGHAQDRDHWRDTALRVEGPVVNRLQSAFCENWTEETGEITAGDRFFPKPVTAGNVSAHVAYTSPSGSVSSVQVLYYMAIASARREIIIQNPYMLPDADAIEALSAAVKRGVHVYVMVPAAVATDSPVVQHASHHNFGTMLQRGVRIWEYQPTLLHQKILIVDGIWSCVGSTNFDDRSFQLNDEISMGVIDRTLATELRAHFQADLRLSHERHFDEWKHRGLWHKMIDGLAYLGSNEL
jgi:cardiolipin synthase